MNRSIRPYLVLLLGCLAACAKSQKAPDDAFSACFESRELEDWDEPQLPRCSEEHDSDADGTIDTAFDSVFDESGRLIESGERGEPLSEVVEYDDEARTKTITRFYEGEQDSRTIERYDEQGNLLEATDEYVVNDTPHVTTLDYDCWGEPLEPWPGPCSLATDYDGDGEPELLTTITWDEQGRESLRVERNFHRDASLILYYEYADDGSWERQEFDDGSDGTIDRIWRAEYDREGRMVRSSWDDDADGREDSFNEIAYDREGRFISDREVRDGSESFVELEYKDGGRLVIMIEHPTEHMPVRSVTHIRFDRGGNLVAEATDLDEDGVPDYCSYYSYACTQ